MLAWVLVGRVDAYVAAFVGRCEHMRRPGQPEMDEPGVRGLLPSIDDPRTRLLVTDDRAYDVLAGLLTDAEGGVITVFKTRCAMRRARRQSAGLEVGQSNRDDLPRPGVGVRASPSKRVDLATSAPHRRRAGRWSAAGGCGSRRAASGPEDQRFA